MQDDLTLAQHLDGAEVTIRVSGEVDLVNAARVLSAGREALDAALADRRALVLDLTGVTFIDSAGIGACVRLLRSAARQDLAARVHLRSPAVVRAFSLMGLVGAFDVRTC